MKRVALAVGVGVFGALVGVWAWPGEAAQAPGGPLPANAAAAPDGMAVLFDGRTLSGWEYDPKVWTVKDGAMRGTGKYGQIFTRDDYEDFRLLVTSRVVVPEENTGNGHLGILFWGDRPKEGTWGTAGGLQVQPPHGAMWDYRTNKNVRPTRVVPRQCSCIATGTRPRSSSSSRPATSGWQSTGLRSSATPTPTPRS